LLDKSKKTKLRRFIPRKPGNSRSCKTGDQGLEHRVPRVVCKFTGYLRNFPVENFTEWQNGQHRANIIPTNLPNSIGQTGQHIESTNDPCSEWS